MYVKLHDKAERLRFTVPCAAYVADNAAGLARLVAEHPDELRVSGIGFTVLFLALRLRLRGWEDNNLVFPDTTPTSNYVVAEPKDFPAGRPRSPKALQHVFRREMRALGYEGLWN